MNIENNIQNESIYAYICGNNYIACSYNLFTILKIWNAIQKYITGIYIHMYMYYNYCTKDPTDYGMWNVAISINKMLKQYICSKKLIFIQN